MGVTFHGWRGEEKERGGFDDGVRAGGAHMFTRGCRPGRCECTKACKYQGGRGTGRQTRKQLEGGTEGRESEKERRERERDSDGQMERERERATDRETQRDGGRKVQGLHGA